MWAQSLLKEFNSNCVVTLPKRGCPARVSNGRLQWKRLGEQSVPCLPEPISSWVAQAPALTAVPVSGCSVRGEEKRKKEKTSCLPVQLWRWGQMHRVSAFPPLLTGRKYPSQKVKPLSFLNLLSKYEALYERLHKMCFKNLVSLLFCTPAFHSKEKQILWLRFISSERNVVRQEAEDGQTLRLWFPGPSQ